MRKKPYISFVGGRHQHQNKNKMNDFRNNLTEVIDNLIQGTDWSSDSADSNMYTWVNLESGEELTITWDINDDNMVEVSSEVDSLEYESLEEAIENITEIVSLFN